MTYTIGIRREDKNKWERRVPLTPKYIKEFKEKYNIKTIIQPSKIRIFSDKEYLSNGAIVKEDISESSIIFAIKEIPIDFFHKNKTYAFFSHTIKGQKHNMPMLKKMMELGCNLIDYEKITDTKGRRLVFFGRYAGIVGMIDTLWAFGQRMKGKGIHTLFSNIKQTIHYKDINDAKNHLEEISKKIKQDGISDKISPLVIGFSGYGNVSKGAQEIIDILPFEEISPLQLENFQFNPSNKVIYKVVFKEKDIVEPISDEKNFELQDYYKKPNLYRSVFHNYIPKLSILMNCIFWNKQYPRLITKDFLKENYTKNFKLQIVGDISVDINGAIEFTEKVTTPDNPVFTYDPLTSKIIDGYSGDGIVVMAIDNLPCEVPKDSSQAFNNSLIPFIPSIVKADFSVDFKDLNLPDEIKKAVILHRGKLTPDYEYIKNYL
jgi:alpha-aminoadipic semialdehyde synthase